MRYLNLIQPYDETRKFSYRQKVAEWKILSVHSDISDLKNSKSFKIVFFEAIDEYQFLLIYGTKTTH